MRRWDVYAIAFGLALLLWASSCQAQQSDRWVMTKWSADRQEVLEDADRAARKRADADREALEADAAWKLNELQDRLESIVR